MYPEAPVLQFHFGNLEKTMEGKFRNGHFNGVGIIVSKFLNIIAPNKAYFGQKDIQQFFIVKQLVKDLSFPVELIRIPTLRESDGLALSSRNLRLSPALRKKAPLMYKALVEAGELLKKGKSIEEIKTFVKELFLDARDFKLEYFEMAIHWALLIMRRKKGKYSSA
jgi:pantoate--beta-alanine ligase